MRTSLAALICVAAASSALVLPSPAQQLPRKALDLKVDMPNGKPIQLSSYKGKPVVLAFILTTCSHCQYTTGLLVKLEKEFAPKGLQVLECAVNSNADALVPGFVQQFKTTFPVGYNFDQDFILDKFLQHPAGKVPSMPILVFIDRTGTIRAEHEGSDDFISGASQEQNIRGEIQKLLAAHATSSANHPPRD
ncbi:MAG TPA: TlpA disulfide reductase family protein [Bryobacteraceae bacterium]|jgi:thiol-disulfide isomerase/thioredoxin|nr:TlpA disulfide reductase family protein [Bryobacteraceae bacterium]